MTGDTFVAEMAAQWISDLVAALFTYGLLLAAALLIGGGLHQWGVERGYRRRDLEIKRERVRQAWTEARENAVTITLPSQRAGEK